MLPSMPIIFSSSRQGSPENVGNISEKDVNKTNENNALAAEGGCLQTMRILSSYEMSSAFDSFPKDDKECDDELVLLADCSPLSEKRKLLAHVNQPKKKKKIDVNHVEVPIEDKSIDDHADLLAEAYFNKAKSTLDEQTFQKFIALLSEAVDEPGSAVALYHKIVELLADYPDLVDDFVSFLHPHQAQECDKFMDYKYFEKCWSFLRKLDAHHMNRFINALEQQTTNRTISLDTLKTNLLPILKGHQHLSDGFLQLLPDEKPSPCLKEDYEDISETSIEDGDWERLRILEHPERGCCQNCCCKCHTAPSHPFCISCNIKFINGQIYVQHGKVLRFARVTFGDVPQIEMLKKLHPALYSKRSKERKTSTSKSHNIGNKECGERSEIPPLEIKCEPHDVDEIAVDDGNGVVDIGCGVEERPDDEDDYWGEESSGGEKSLDSEITSDPDTNDSTRLIGMVTPVSPLANTQDCSTPITKEHSEPEIIEKEEIITTENERETINHNVAQNELSEKLNYQKEERNNDENKEWTRDEDKMILQAFQKEIGTEQTFSKISNLMPSRSMDDIQSRFKVLMSLLEKMASGSQDTYPVG